MLNINLVHRLYYKSSIILLLVFISFSFANADLIPVKELKAEVNGIKLNDEFTANGMIAWFYPENDYNVDSYNIYVKDGKHNDDGNFTLFKNVPAENSKNGKGSYLIQFKDLKGKTGGWTFTVTAVSGNNESEKEYYVYAQIHNTKPLDKLIIISNPLLRAKIDVEYEYVPEFQTTIQNPEPIYSLQNSPDGAKINEATGEINWTPAKSGQYFFNILLKVKNNDGKVISANQQWTVKVSECDESASFNAIIKDENGNKIDFGVIEVFSYENDNGKINKNSYIQEKFSNGEIEIKNLDKGEYYISVKAYSNKNSAQYYIVWYDNAYKFEDASPLVLNCGDTKTINFVAKEIPLPNFYKISGKVFDAEKSEPIRNAIVQFIGKNSNTDKQEMFTFYTDKNGLYEAKLPNIFKYIAMAFAKGNNSNSNTYLIQYYEMADNPDDAKILTLTENLQGVDFYLKNAPVYFNSITGNVINVDGEAINKVEVTAYLVDANKTNSKFRYYGKSVVTDDFGNFKIENLIPGNYILFAHSSDKNLAPGFYNEKGIAVLKWEEATKVVVDETGNSGDYSITLTNAKKVNGKGNIHGNVKKNKGIIESGNGATSADDIVNGANVYMINSSNMLIQANKTDVDGAFVMNNLAAGNYKIIVDKIGYSAYESEIIIKEDEITEREISLYPKDITSVDDEMIMNIEILPNPASDFIKVNFNENVDSKAEISMINSNGIELLKLVNLQGNSQILEVKNLASGVYFIRIQNGIAISYKPVLIIR